MGAGRIVVGHVLQVVGKDQCGHLALANGGAHGTVCQVAHLRGHGGLLHESAGYVLEHRDQVDLLLVMRAKRRARLLAHNGQHRHMIQLGIVKPGQQVRGAGAGGGKAYAQLAGELGVGRGHEGGHFLVPRLHELDVPLTPLQRAQKPVDAVARIAEDAGHAPRLEPLPEEIADCRGHVLPSRSVQCSALNNGLSHLFP